MNEEQNSKNTRRNFLKIGLAAGATTIIGGGLASLSSCKPEDHGEKVKLLTTDGKVVEVNPNHLTTCCPPNSEIRHGIPGRKFVMVIDLAKCKNARECIISCQKMHHLPPEQEWLKVFLMKDEETTSPYWMPKPCFHCDNPPCVSVCPVGATFKRDDGVVLVDNERCIGCKFCMTGCPYSARVFNWGEVRKGPNGVKYSPEIGIPQVHGTVGKCDFCPDMARDGVLPDCVRACPNGVIYYGDINEDVVSNGVDIVRFSDLIKGGGYQYAADLGTAPSVYYLPTNQSTPAIEKGLKDMPEDIIRRYEDVLKHPSMNED
jgi:molybdopterin-containing oxidoreductase family iron-sulfur binding subunit